MANKRTGMKDFSTEENVQAQIAATIWLLKKNNGLQGEDEGIARGLRNLLSSCGFDHMRDSKQSIKRRREERGE